MTGRASRGETFLRIVLTVVVLVDLVSLFFFVGAARANAVANGFAPIGLYDVVSAAAVRAVIVVIGVAGAIAFGRQPGRLWEGLIALGALGLLSTVHAQLFGSPWRHLFYSGLTLLGWLLGLAVSRYRGAPTDESYARYGSIALLGAAYLNSGISKIVYGGFDWISGVPLQVAVIGQDGLVSDGGILSAYRDWVVMTPEVARILSVATFGLELAGPLMLVGRKTRCCIALALVAMHLNIYLVTTHIVYWESVVLLVVFALSRDEPAAESMRSSAIPNRAYHYTFAGGVAFLTLWALLAIGHQARRYAYSRVAAAMAVARPLPAPTAAPLRQVGPFLVGQKLAEMWSVDSLELSDTGLIVALSGKPGHARFELTCAADRYGPFDLDAAHILYFKDSDTSNIETVGTAVREQVRGAVEGHEVCEQLASWRTAAQAGRTP